MPPEFMISASTLRTSADYLPLLTRIAPIRDHLVRQLTYLDGIGLFYFYGGYHCMHLKLYATLYPHAAPHEITSLDQLKTIVLKLLITQGH